RQLEGLDQIGERVALTGRGGCCHRSLLGVAGQAGGKARQSRAFAQRTGKQTHGSVRCYRSGRTESASLRGRTPGPGFQLPNKVKTWPGAVKHPGPNCEPRRRRCAVWAHGSGSGCSTYLTSTVAPASSSLALAASAASLLAFSR